MKIFNSPELLRAVLKNTRYKIKIIDIGHNYTKIQVKNINIEIPYVLNKESQYFFVYNNNSIEIIEENPRKQFKNISIQLKKNKQEIKKKQTANQLITNDDDYDINTVINEMFVSDANHNHSQNNFKKFFITRDNTKEYGFFINIPFYYEVTPVFIKVGNNRASLCILSNTVNENNKKNFIDLVKGDNRLIGRNVSISFFDNKADFINKILSEIHTNVDIKI